MADFDTIVIGAGVSGLAAARILTQQGRRVVVLEARDRIGGRVWTDRAHGEPTDVGASWIHGVTGSPVAAAADAFGLRTVEFTVGGYQVDSRPIAYFAPDGSRLSDTAARAFAADVHDVDAALVRVLADDALPADASYRDATERALSAMQWDHDRTQRVREYLEHRSEEQYGAWIEDLAAHGLDDDAIDGDEVVFPDGYDELPAHLADGLDVRLGVTVDRIVWRDGAGASVASGPDVLTADSVVVTVPVGVLRSGALTIEPPLPEPVASSLSRLAMNAFEKIVLRFPTRFWAAGTDDEAGEPAYAFRQQGPEGAWWHSWYDLSRLHGTPTLLTFAAGPAAVATRNWSDAQIADDVVGALRRLFGEQVEAPTSVVVTRWQDDPYALGSYAYMLPGSTTADHDALATPIGGVLHIAGEATWTDDPATVVAAMCSGHRAACDVLGHAVPIETLWSRSGPAWT